MVIGGINAQLEVIVPLVIAGPSGQEQKVDCLLATGFAGDLFLPPAQINALKLPQIGAGPVNYPPGNPTEVPLHQADVLWCGEKHTISVFAYGQHPVMGTGLLQGYCLSIRIVEGSPVVIEPL